MEEISPPPEKKKITPPPRLNNPGHATVMEKWPSANLCWHGIKLASLIDCLFCTSAEAYSGGGGGAKGTRVLDRGGGMFSGYSSTRFICGLMIFRLSNFS